MGSAKVQGELWNKAPSDWATKQEANHTPLWTALLDACGVSASTRFLDAGCGGGGASVLAAERNAQVTGLDASEGMIAFAQGRVPDGDFHVGDLQVLPFEDNAFDVVFAANSIQYAADRVAALQELRRVCAENGRVVVALFSTPDKVDFRNIFRAIVETLPAPPNGDGPFGLSAPGILEDLLEQAGLTVVASGEVNCPFVYPDFETFWTGSIAAGPVQGVLRSVSEDTMKEALRNAVSPYKNGDGSIHMMENWFSYTVATP